MKRLIAVLGIVVIIVMSANYLGYSFAENENYESMDYEYIIVNDKAVIVGYKGENPRLLIPENLNGYPVNAVESLGIQTGVEEITIPDCVSVAGNALGLCLSLAKINVSENHPDLKLVDQVLFSKDGKTLICYPSELPGKEYSVPDGTVIIGDSAFCDCPFLERIQLPSSVKTIENAAFCACNKLVSINLPQSIETFGEMALANTALKKIDLSHLSELTAIPNRMAYGCWQLSEIIIPESVVRMGDEAFAFSSVSTVDLPPELSYIGINPFRWCGNLRGLTVREPSERYKFEYPFLLDILENQAVSCVCRVSGEIVLPDVTAIGDCCCNGCEWITGLTIPPGVEHIGREAFSFCTCLRTVRIEGACDLIILKNAFEECYELSLLIISGNVTYIGPDAFRKDDELHYVVSSDETVKQYFDGSRTIVVEKEEDVQLFSDFGPFG